VFTQAMGPRPPVQRATMPEPVHPVDPPPPPPIRRTLSDLATTLKPKAARTLSKLNMTGSDNKYFTPSSRPTSPVSAKSNRSFDFEVPGGLPADMPEIEKKRLELQIRVYRARSQMAPHIPLRIFRKPEECIEASQILDKLHIH